MVGILKSCQGYCTEMASGSLSVSSFIISLGFEANTLQVPWMVHALPRVEKLLHPLAKARLDHAL